MESIQSPTKQYFSPVTPQHIKTTMIDNTENYNFSAKLKKTMVNVF